MDTVLDAEELLQRLIIEKIKREWHQYIQHEWKEERWLKIYLNKQGEEVPSTIDQLPQGFFESMAVEINETIAAKLNLPRKELEKYTTSASSLSRFLGKHHDFHDRYEKKKSGLAIFAGYYKGVYTLDSWSDFQQKHKQFLAFWKTWREQRLALPKPIEEEAGKTYQLTTTSQTPPETAILYQHFYDAYQHGPQYVPVRRWKVYSWAASLIGLAALALFFYWQTSGNGSESVNAAFGVVKIKAGENIATVLLYYDVSQVKADSVYIKLGGISDADPGYSKVTKSKDTIAVMLYKPIVKARLIANNRTIGHIDIQVPTTGWVGWSFTNLNKENENSKTLAGCELVEEKALTIPFTKVSDGFKPYYFTNFHNITDFGFSGDQFTLEVRTRMVYKPALATCNHFAIELCGLKNCIQYPVEISGCEYWLLKQHRLGGDATVMDSAIANVSQFTHLQSELEQWNVMKVKRAGEFVHFFWNDKPIATRKFLTEIGEVKRLSIDTKGSWQVDWIRVKNEKEEIVYQEDFEACEK